MRSVATKRGGPRDSRIAPSSRPRDARVCSTLPSMAAQFHSIFVCSFCLICGSVVYLYPCARSMRAWAGDARGRFLAGGAAWQNGDVGLGLARNVALGVARRHFFFVVKCCAASMRLLHSQWAVRAFHPWTRVGLVLHAFNGQHCLPRASLCVDSDTKANTRTHTHTHARALA